MTISRKLLPILDKIDEAEGFVAAIRLIDNSGLHGIDYSMPRELLLRALEDNRKETKQLVETLRQEAA